MGEMPLQNEPTLRNSITLSVRQFIEEDINGKVPKIPFLERESGLAKYPC